MDNDPILGSVMIFAGNFAPRGYLYCNGATLSIMQNQALFSILGVQYGGDGVSNFKLPDLRPDVIEYQVTLSPEKVVGVVPVVKGKREWQENEPKWLIATEGLYPSRP